MFGISSIVGARSDRVCVSFVSIFVVSLLVGCAPTKKRRWQLAAVN